MSVRLGELLVQKGIVTLDQLNSALKHQRERGGALGSALVQLSYASEEAIAKALSEQYGVPFVNLSNFEPDPGVAQLIPMDTAVRYQVLPVKKMGTTITVATTDPTNLLALDLIKFTTGYNVQPVITSLSSINQAIEKHYGTEQSIELQKVYDELAADGEYELDIASQEEKLDLSELQKVSAEAPIVKLVNIVLAEAIRQGASDIHLEPYEGEFRVRYRTDGVLYSVMNPPVRLRDAMISRIKIMSNLDISERRLPQDGRIKIYIKQGSRRKELDCRVSSLPTLFGEKVVLRILDREKLPPNLNELGFESASQEKMERAIAKPFGMVLVTGPTGSGKTSTLYTALRKLNTPDVNIMTVEDPVEFNFPGVN